MKIHINKLPGVIQEFAQARIIAKAPTPSLQFGIGFAIPYIASSVNKMLAENELVKTLGIVAPDGTIEIETAYSAANTALANAGGKVQMYGITFDISDIDALSEIAKRHVGA